MPSAVLFLRYVCCGRSLSLGSTNRALAGTSAALDAGLSVDNELAVTLGDSLNGASSYASAAGYAIIGNLVSHGSNLHLKIFYLLHGA